jgi:hypothetical protein
MARREERDPAEPGDEESAETIVPILTMPTPEDVG